ncbi:hypothetical protein [Acinetobacter baumannii]|uniref:hypothetical protein n=1 Tax=Acinetobacter baumannii TaxID=470 RepID=UPI001CC25922|nr:hypothetical protein [Acinetobacter baumannii]
MNNSIKVLDGFVAIIKEIVLYVSLKYKRYMTLTFKKLLCIGGDNGKFVEHKEFHQIFIDGMFLEPETYKPTYLMNPLTKGEELFFVLTDLTRSEAEEILAGLLEKSR